MEIPKSKKTNTDSYTYLFLYKWMMPSVRSTEGLPEKKCIVVGPTRGLCPRPPIFPADDGRSCSSQSSVNGDALRRSPRTAPLYDSISLSPRSRRVFKTWSLGTADLTSSLGLDIPSCFGMAPSPRGLGVLVSSRGVEPGVPSRLTSPSEDFVEELATDISLVSMAALTWSAQLSSSPRGGTTGSFSVIGTAEI